MTLREERMQNLLATPSPFMAERFHNAALHAAENEELSTEQAIWQGNRDYTEGNGRTRGQPIAYFGCHGAMDRFRFLFGEHVAESLEMRIDMLTLTAVMCETGL